MILGDYYFGNLRSYRDILVAAKKVRHLGLVGLEPKKSYRSLLILYYYKFS